MRYLTGSQWRFMRVSVIYSPSLVHVRSLADEFWTYWILVQGFAGISEQDPTAGSQPGGDKDTDDHLLQILCD